MTEQKNAYQQIILRLLREVIRVCLRHSVQLQDFIELAKVAYVEEATSSLANQNQSVSASRISAMTGVHRKDIARFSKSESESNNSRNLISRIMVQWQHDKKFTTKAGKPRVLDGSGRASDFAQLVDAVTGGNVDPYAALFEMKRLGIVSQNSNKKIKLLWKDFVPPADEATSLEMLAEDAEDLSRAVLNNIDKANETPHLHLKTEFTRIPKTDLPKLRKWLIVEGSAFHERVRKQLSKFDLDLTKSTDTTCPQEEHRVSVGTFSFDELMEKENV